MKKLVIIGIFFLLVSILSACSSTSGASRDKLIEPGDKIADFTISTGTPGNFTYGFEVQCSEPMQDNSYTCNATVGETINVSTGLFDTTGKGSLDQVWTHSNYQMFIDDRPVDLAAFGTTDYSHPQVGVIRFANVVITTSKPGTITVRDTGLYDNGDAFTSTSTYIFSQP